MKSFYIGREWEGDGLQMKSYFNAKEADYNSEEWVKIEAETEQEAMSRFFEEFDKWQEAQKHLTK